MFYLRITGPQVKRPWGSKLETKKQFFFLWHNRFLKDNHFSYTDLTAKFLPVLFLLLLLVKIYIFEDQFTQIPLLKSLNPFSANVNGFPGGHKIAWNVNTQGFSHRGLAPFSFLVTCTFFPPVLHLFVLSLLTLICLLKSTSLNTWVNHDLAELMKDWTLLLKLVHMKACVTTWTHICWLKEATFCVISTGKVCSHVSL